MAFMDDLLKTKASNSRSLSVVKEMLSDCNFYLDKEPIPTVSEKL